MRKLREMSSIRSLGVAGAIGLMLGGCADPAGAGGLDVVDGTGPNTTAPAAADDPTASEQPSPVATEPDSPFPEPVVSSEPTPSDGRAVVDVVAVGTMGNTTVVSAGGYVEGVIETGGTCSFELTQGGVTVAGQSTAEPDATTTWCANVELALPMPGQPWTLELRYASPTSVGTGAVTSTGELS